jgi:hypothetical protein
MFDFVVSRPSRSDPFDDLALQGKTVLSFSHEQWLAAENPVGKRPTTQQLLDAIYALYRRDILHTRPVYRVESLHAFFASRKGGVDSRIKTTS